MESSTIYRNKRTCVCVCVCGVCVCVCVCVWCFVTKTYVSFYAKIKLAMYAL